MQTFLPYPSFTQSAQALDYKRLGKQRVEAMQIIKAITGEKTLKGKSYKGWVKHPCSVMWKNYVPALKRYHNVMIDEWVYRGYENSMKKYPDNEVSDLVVDLPYWFGDKDFHKSHKANLLRKNYDFYLKPSWFFVSPKLPYVWFDEKQQKYHIDENYIRIYEGDDNFAYKKPTFKF